MGWFENAKKATLKFEGLVTHMYLDTKGFVTVGVGHLLSTKSAATNLAFVHRSGGQKATKAEIEADWTNVSKQSKGKAARAYEAFTELDLPKATATKLFDKKLKDFESGIKGIYKDFAKLPDPVKEALMDIAYNTGVGA